MQPSASPPVSKKQLILYSVIADALDIVLVLGAAPGPWSLFIDLPITILHFKYAGPKAAFVLAEYLPLVGFLPVYTVAALLYPDPQKHQKQIDFVQTAAPPNPNFHSKYPIIDVEPILPPRLPPPIPEPPRHLGIELRLQKLADLLRQNLISQTEYDAKKQQILSDL